LSSQREQPSGLSEINVRWPDKGRDAGILRGSDLVRRFLKRCCRVLEIDAYGAPRYTACFNNPDYREHLFGKIEDYLKTYPELAGIAWGCERMGPLMNMIGGNWSNPSITCFCGYCERKARERGVSIDRARQGYIELDRLFAAARQDQRLKRIREVSADLLAALKKKS